VALTATEMLDMAAGQRQATFAFDLLDASGAVIGELHPVAESVPSIEQNINRTIKRSMDGLLLTPSDAAAVNTLSDRVRPRMVLPVGDPLAYPLGVFLFGGADSGVHSWGRDLAASMVDLTYVLDQKVATTVAYDQGTSIAAALAAQFVAAGIASYAIDPVSTLFGSPVVWPAGTSRYAIMAEMAGMAGCFSPYFDNAGVGRVRIVPDLATAPVDLVYDLGGRIFADTIVETDDLLTAPNRYIVIDNSASAAPIVGVYNVPASAPFSEANRGFVVAVVLDVQGLENQATANARAAAAYAEDSATFRWVSFAGAPDPRHDTFQVVDFLGERYREQRWSMRLVDGAPMTHDLRRVYS
jgi:hypothetical protein